MVPEEKYIRSVVEGCTKRGVQVSQELASVFYKSFTLNFNMNTNSQKKPSENTNEKIVEQCINRLCNHKDPVILCIKMELILDYNYRNREFIINKVNEDNEQNIRPILNEIIDNINLIGDDTSIYYQKIIQFIILTNYMGDPTSLTTIQETSAAYKNIMDRNKLLDLKKQLPSSIRKQLKEVANLVCSIRLYNMDQKACKGEMFDVINTLTNGIDLLLQNIDQELDDSCKKVTAITSKICQCYKVDRNFLAVLFAIRINLATIGCDQLNEYKTVLVFYHQYKKNLKTIKKDLSKCKIEFPELLNKYNIALKEIRHYFQNTNDSVEDIIISELVNLSAIWNEMIQIMNYLSITANLILTMKRMTNEIMNINEHFENSQIIDIIKTNNDEQIIETYPLHPMCKWFPSSSNPVEGRKLFADGYCVVMIVETEGTLIKHNKKIGVIQYCDEWFGFSCVQAAIHFATKPFYYLNLFYNIVSFQTHLLYFFHLNEQITEKKYVAKLCGKYNMAEVQTHPHDTITRNTLEIKQCIQLDNIPKMETKSAQTMDVYKSVKVQTASCDIGCNTMSEKGTNTNQSVYKLPIRSNYKPYVAVEYDTNSLVYPTRKILPNTN